MARDSYEIYYFQNGRWSVHATFESGERDLAVAEAHKVDKTLGFPVRLVRETFYAETNTSEEVVTWQSAKAKQMGDSDGMLGGAAKPASPAPVKKPQKPAPLAPPRRKDEKTDPPPAPAPRKVAKKPPPKKKAKRRSNGAPSTLTIILTKAAIVALWSLIISGIVVGTSWVILYVLVEKLHLFPLSQDDTLAMLALVFLISYGMSALYNIAKQFNLRFSFRRKAKTEEKEAAGGPSAADMMRRMRANQADADAANAEADVLANLDIAELRERVAAEDAAESGGEDFTTDVQAAETAVEVPPPEPAPPSPPPQQPEPAPKAEAKKPPPEEKKPSEEKKAPAKPAQSAAETEARQGMASLTRDAVAAATREQPQMNAFSRFGLNLYLAGACAITGQAKKLGRAAQLLVLCDSLQAAGNTAERAESFCAELPSHAKNPRYATMIQAGSAAMTRQLNGQPANTQELTSLLSEWTRPEKRPHVPSSFTFLFTDIVNSTALTSQLGNAGAQRVVRAHNQAVRGAIQAYQGREVKHTGDGIMATFPSPVAAVQAAIRAQKEIVAHSAANPSVAFAIRIGINVGEAVEEDNDFFGAAVQMTARVCSVATPANVWVSRAVVDACKGQRLGFIPRGSFQMKGIQQARPLYEVAYTDAHKNEISNL